MVFTTIFKLGLKILVLLSTYPGSVQEMNFHHRTHPGRQNREPGAWPQHKHLSSTAEAVLPSGSHGPGGAQAGLWGAAVPQRQVAARLDPLQVDSSEQAGTNSSLKSLPTRRIQPFQDEKGRCFLERPTRKAETHEEKVKHTDLRPPFLGLKKVIYQ